MFVGERAIASSLIGQFTIVSTVVWQLVHDLSKVFIAAIVWPVNWTCQPKL